MQLIMLILLIYITDLYLGLIDKLVQGLAAFIFEQVIQNIYKVTDTFANVFVHSAKECDERIFGFSVSYLSDGQHKQKTLLKSLCIRSISKLENREGSVQQCCIFALVFLVSKLTLD